MQDGDNWGNRREGGVSENSVLSVQSLNKPKSAQKLTSIHF